MGVFTLRFKRIELIGFKSFADKTVINFDDGITAIVGPNGCGKSNVADSIRWVLGEQSSKLLRGSSMQDVIFNGTQSRKPLSYCEVSLVLDNSNKELKLDYDEVILTRKLYRSGESEYLLNNNTCRLKDIVDILHDAGIGRDGYSIIGQGKVEEIVSSKPENRRGIFEEAAGISKFKEKKAESERKLARTRENIARLKDILIEIERQLNPLKAQAEKAKRYLELKDELKSLEINNYIYQYDSASSKKQEIGNRINAIAEEIDDKQKNLDSTIENYNKNYADIQKIDLTTKDLYNQVVDLTVELERKSGQTTIIKERLKLLQDQLEKLDEQLAQENSIIENDKKLLANKQYKIASNAKTIESLNEQNEELNKKYLSVVDELTKSEDEAEQNQKMMISALSQLSDIKADISKLNAERVSSVERQAELKASQMNLEKTIQKNSDDFAKISADINSNNQLKQKIQKQIEETSERTRQTNATIAELTENFADQSSAFASLSARKNMLEEMQRNFDGFNGAVKRLLEQSQRNQPLKNSFVGVVANLMDVPEKFRVAIEMALGGSVQNIVTENEEKAEQIIDYLKQNKFGRATFLPITALRPRNIENYVSQISNQSGYFGIASDLISYDKKLDNVFKNLLGGTVIVDNLVTAVKFAKQTRYSFKLVTLDGDVVNPQGSMTGGSKTRSAESVVGRDKEIEELARELEKLTLQKQQTLQSLNQSKAELAVLQDKLAKLSSQFNQLSIEESKQITIRNQYKTILDNSMQEQKQLDEQLAQIDAKVKAIDIQLEKNSKIKTSIDGSKEDADKNIEKRQQDFDNLKRERDDYNTKVLDIKVKIASVQSETQSLNDDIDRLNFEISQNQKKVEQTKQEIDNNKQTIEKAQQVIAAAEQNVDYKETNDKLTSVKEKLANLENYKKELQTELKKFDDDRVLLATRVDKLKDKLSQENINLTKVDTDIQNMQERVWTEYGLNYSTALPFKKQDYVLDDGLKKASETKRAIDNLGYVNVNAIEDSKVYQERFDDYTSQIADLTKAENDLTKIIADLANEMITRFQTSFDTINQNFGKIFRELFGGGSATLELLPSESGDVLQQGVDIKVEPPGKKLQSITLLSGGEKALTAIAILFAILKLRPMPFVLLDEIEAALDDANVGRFAKYLQKFSGETQFIVITHRKPTMELADNLYGVTMPEKGVSKVVSVKLSEAIAVDNQSASANKTVTA